MNALSEGAINWLDKRGLDVELASRLGIYTGDHPEIGKCIVYPIRQDGKVINHKYRNKDKDFRQDKGAPRTFYNIDCLNDPAVHDGAEVIITEGYEDALSAMQAGLPFAMSVPDGAPAHRNAAGEIIPESDGDVEDIAEDKRFSFIWENWTKLQRVKRFVLAVDGDEPGQRLQRELVRRLGAVRCKFVRFPADCKDLNDVLVKKGPAGVHEVIRGAKPFPIKGLYRLSDYPDTPNPETYPIDIFDVSERFKPYRGSFTVITGVPGHGKSTIINTVIARMVKQYGLKAAMGSFEAAPVPFLRDHLRTFHARRPPELASAHAIATADAWIEDNFVFIDQDPVDDSEDIDLEWIIEKTEEVVIRDGIDILLIDPYNEIEHKKLANETETEYVSRAIRLLKRLARRRQIMVFMVAHPVKMGGGKDGISKPNLYDISGSANWYNKVDFGIVIWRDNLGSSTIEWDQKKCKHHHFAGTPGVISLVYNPQCADFVTN
jgi:twinkle protein